MRLSVKVLGFLLLFTSLVFSQTSPLIMKHADSLAVARKRGQLLLQGRVHFVHDSVEFRTQRATWNKDYEVVQCEGGFLFTHPSGFIHAHTGVYQKRKNIATATGEVNAGDSAKTYAFTGEHVIYDRKEEILTMSDKPVLYQFDKQKNGTVDTVVVKARRIIYRKKDGFAEAYRDVQVTQKDMVVTCDTGYFDRANNWLSMKGNPTFDMKNYHLTGDSIFLVLDSTGKSLKSALVIRNAHGIQEESPKKGSPGSVTEAFGDTLYAEFNNNKVERLYVNLNAKGFFYEKDLKDFQNLMDGNRLDLFFKDGKMDHALVSGKAQSTYYYVTRDRIVSGRNEAAGDTIRITFDPVKNAVKKLKMIGSSTLASGRYVDMEKEQRKLRAEKQAERDSLNKKMREENLRARAEEELKKKKAQEKETEGKK